MKHSILNRDITEENVKTNYSKVAWFYDVWGKCTESKAADKVLEFAHIQNGESVLEVAIGTGVFFERIVKLNSNGSCEGIELSASMKELADKRLINYETNYKISQGSAYNLPFNNSTFDLLVNNFMIDLLPENDFDKVLTEFNRVLKPNGRAVISTMTFGKSGLNKIWDFIAKTMPKLLTGCRPVDISSNLRNCGFIIIEEAFVSQNTFPTLIISALKK